MENYDPFNVEEEEVVKTSRFDNIVDKVEEFLDDHGTAILYTIVFGGAAIIYGQSIRYLHYLNKFAKKGIFPGSWPR